MISKQKLIAFLREREIHYQREAKKCSDIARYREECVCDSKAKACAEIIEAVDEL